MGKRTEDLLTTCRRVLDAKAGGLRTVTVNSVEFDDNVYDGRGGRCQENVRKAFEATTGTPMPGKACCAGRTYLHLALNRPALRVVAKGANMQDCEPGDFVFFSGGPPCNTCRTAVGHVAIWLQDGPPAQMFQHTSRAGLGITRAGPTNDQRRRFLGAFRLIPQAPPAAPRAVPPAAPPGQAWAFVVTEEPNGDMTATGMATRFNDHTTRTGVPADRAGLVACSLPRELCNATEGSGFAGVPDLTLVRVYCPATARTICCPVIDEGPAWMAEAGTGKPGSAMVDLTPEAGKRLGLAPGQNAQVRIRVLASTAGAMLQAQKGLLERA